MTTFSLELVTPSRVLWSGEAEAVSMRTDGGEATFLANHSPFIAALDITLVRIEGPSGGEGGEGGTPDGADGTAGDAQAGASENDSDGAASRAGAEIRAAVHGGFVHVDANRVVILGSVAELASDIDVERARRALETATEKLGAEPEDKPAGTGRADRDGKDGAEDDEHAIKSPPGGEHGAFLDPSSPAAAVARAKVRLEAAGQPAA